MKKKQENKAVLKTLQHIRTNAKNDYEKEKAQRDIDEYFFGKPVKKKGKKKQKETYIPDDWEY